MVIVVLIVVETALLVVVVLVVLISVVEVVIVVVEAEQIVTAQQDYVLVGVREKKEKEPTQLRVGVRYLISNGVTGFEFVNTYLSGSSLVKGVAFWVDKTYCVCLIKTIFANHS